MFSVSLFSPREIKHVQNCDFFFNIRENISKFKKQNKKELWLDNTYNNVHAVQGLVSVLGMILNVHYLSSVWWRNTQLWEEEITATSPVHVVWHLPTMKHLMSKQQCKKSKITELNDP